MNDNRHNTVLRPEHAFVVQFSPDTQVDSGRVEGRVEHLKSRQAMRFQSLDALLSFVARVLQEVHDAQTRSES